MSFASGNFDDEGRFNCGRTGLIIMLIIKTATSSVAVTVKVKPPYLTVRQRLPPGSWKTDFPLFINFQLLVFGKKR